MQLTMEELERKVSKDIIIKTAVDEFGVNHTSKIVHLVNLLYNESWENQKTVKLLSHEVVDFWMRWTNIGM